MRGSHDHDVESWLQGCGTLPQVPNPSHLSVSGCRVGITIVPATQNCYNACEVPNVSLD